MSKKHFIALADCLRALSVFQMDYKSSDGKYDAVVPMLRYQDVVDTLADFCQTQNSDFKRGRWLDYIAGVCGPNGGAVKKAGTR